MICVRTEAVSETVSEAVSEAVCLDRPIEPPIVDIDDQSAAEPVPITPTAVHQKVNVVLRASMQNIRVRGELTNLNMRGHTRYFAIKDECNRLDCVLWPSCAQHCDDRALAALRNGLNIVVRGTIAGYARFSKLQCVVQSIEVQNTEGTMQAQLREWRAELEANGAFDPDIKRCVPDIFDKLAIVTSAEGAALQDILQILREHEASMEVRVYPCTVQGRDCARTICAQLDAIARLPPRHRPDAVLVTRGGGSREDLFEFNNPLICKALRRLSAGHDKETGSNQSSGRNAKEEAGGTAPVITALGHQVDTHLGDMVADKMFITPSAAAQHFGSAHCRLREALEVCTREVHTMMHQAVAQRRSGYLALRREVNASDMRSSARSILRMRETQMRETLRVTLNTRKRAWERLRNELLKSPLQVWGSAGNMAILRTPDGHDFDTSLFDDDERRQQPGNDLLRLVLPSQSGEHKQLRTVTLRYEVIDT